MENVDEAKSSVESEVTCDSHRHDEKMSLIIATEKEDINTVLLLLDSGANIKAIKDGWTALH